jgi:hypothetical protein
LEKRLVTLAKAKSSFEEAQQNCVQINRINALLFLKSYLK